jgi:hypothetical protein
MVVIETKSEIVEVDGHEMANHLNSGEHFLFAFHIHFSKSKKKAINTQPIIFVIY